MRSAYYYGYLSLYIYFYFVYKIANEYLGTKRYSHIYNDTQAKEPISQVKIKHSVIEHTSCTEFQSTSN